MAAGGGGMSGGGAVRVCAVQKARPCRGLKDVLRSLGFLSRALGSHGGVQSKERTGSPLCFRKDLSSPAEEDGLERGRNEGQIR